MSIMSAPIGATLTYKPHGAFLPVDLEFPWATPDDMVFILAAFRSRQGRGRVTRAEVVAALEEARESQMGWHAERMRTALLRGLGRWAKLLPSRLIDRVVELAMNQYYESTAQWAIEMADLYEQLNHLNGQVGLVRARQEGTRARLDEAGIPSYGPRLLCSGGCTKGIPLGANPLVLPEGWTWADEEKKSPRCPEHSAADVTTSKAAS